MRGMLDPSWTPNLRDTPEFLAAARKSRRLHRGWVSPSLSSKSLSPYVTPMQKKEFRGFLVCRHDLERGLSHAAIASSGSEHSTGECALARAGAGRWVSGRGIPRGT